MNKDVIYIEPEDDITDIISRLSSAKEKVVALVPPKNLGILRSAVNTKLIAKTAKKEDKVAVFVTTDKSLMKLAMSAGIPVAKTLQSRPVVPTAADLSEKKADSSEIIDDLGDDEAGEPSDAAKAKTGAKKPENTSKSAKKPVETLNSADIDEDLEKDAKKGSKKSEKGKNGDKKSKIPSLDKYRKRIIIGGVAGVVLIIFLVWALVFAPAVNIVVAMHTTANNFSENVTLVTDKDKQNLDSSILYVEKQEEKVTNSVEFEATGKKNVGEKASGVLAVTAYLDDAKTINLPVGTTFTYNGLAYLSTNDAVLTWDGDSNSVCENYADGGAKSVRDDGCKKSASIRITASESGEKYNISATASGWHSSVADIYSTANSGAISGGTDKTITIVQQSDIDSAKDKLQTDSKLDKDALKNKFSKDYITIDPSYKEETGDIKSTPAAGEEVSDGVKPKLEITRTATMYGVDKTTIEKYIKAKSKDSIASDQKIYSYGDPYFEKFVETDGGFSAKLKTTTQVGPEVTEQEVLEKAKGKKIGEVQSLIKSISGVSSVTIDRSFFWVSSVPDDANKITVELKVEE